MCGLSPLIHWCLTTSSPPYCSPNSLQVPHFFPDLFFPPCLYSYSPLCENAQMLNVIGCAHTKNVWHSLKHLSSSHSLLYPPAFLTVWNSFTAFALSPFHAIHWIHHYTFCHLPSKLSTLALIPHPSLDWSLSQTSSDSQTKAFDPLNPSSSFTSSHPNRNWDIRIKFSILHLQCLVISLPASHTYTEGSCPRDRVTAIVKTHKLTGGRPCRDTVFINWVQLKVPKQSFFLSVKFVLKDN